MADNRPDPGELILLLGETSTRETVPSRLQQFGEPAIEPLIAALQDSDENVRQGAAWAISRLNNSLLGALIKPAALDPLIERLRSDESGRVRSQALNTLIVLTTESERAMLVDSLIAALEDSQETVRAEAARMLGQIRDTQAVEPLRAMLENDAAVKVRGRAAYALAYIEPGLETLKTTGAAGIEALLTATRDHERSVRLRAIWALGQLKAEQAIKPLADMLEGGASAPEKRRAAEALGQIGSTSAADSLIMALQFDADDGVRAAAAEALGRLDDRRVVSMLVRSLHHDAIPVVRASAARALEWAGSPNAIEPLILALRDSSSEVRFRVVCALGVLGDARAVDPLTTLLKDANITRQIRMAAEQALAEIKQREGA